MLDTGRSIEVAGFDEVVEGEDGAVEGGMEHAKLSDELEALGLVLNGQDVVMHIHLL